DAGGAGDAAGDPQRAAQDRVLAAGGRLVAEEDAKRRKHPLDRWDELAARAAEGRFPRGTDVFLTKYHGLFYVAPAQDSYMCRLRIPGGILSAHQLHGIADLADDRAGGYADITTRANLQLREIPAGAAPEVLMRLADLGLTARGSGADNVRNVTGSPTAGIDPQELLDTRPHTRALHHHILNTRDLYGLPRKFNVAFDGGGRIPVLEDTNDVAWNAVAVADGHGVAPGTYYLLGLGGITGHRDLARATGVIVPPDDAVRVTDAIIRVFIAEGTRTDRTRARLKYLLDAWGVPRFLDAVEEILGSKLARVTDAALAPRPPRQKHGHLGIHDQKQPGLAYVGIATPVGRLTSARLRGLAAIAARHGTGTLRLTVWQNLLIGDIPRERLDAALADIAALGLGWETSALRGGLVACTGSAGCKFAAGDTKRHAAALADWLDARIAIDAPINIHLTGCHHSCAQHFIADIGLLACKVEQGEDLIEGYDLHVGGGAGAEGRIGRLIRPRLAVAEVAPAILALLRAWIGQRADGESFWSWSGRQDEATLLAATTGATTAADMGAEVLESAG
ncbi:NirA family protein, partial [Acidisphaera rubrifaciens]|uniref:NirA family protein n=1 Tax=Acidisphaera rubrifaciens TaxID=50715 RepID=UPI0006623D69